MILVCVLLFSQIVAIAARSKEKADTFAEKFNIPNSYGSYEDLANAKDIDIGKCQHTGKPVYKDHFF